MKYILMAFVFAVSFSALAQSTGAAGGGAPTTGELVGSDDVKEGCEGNVTGSLVPKVVNPVPPQNPAATGAGAGVNN